MNQDADRQYIGLTLGESRVIGGVCSGLADYFGLQKNGVRAAFVIISFFFFISVLAYIILWLVLPEYPATNVMRRHLQRQAKRRSGQ